jgi:hypothetical protein
MTWAEKATSKLQSVHVVLNQDLGQAQAAMTIPANASPTLNQVVVGFMPGLTLKDHAVGVLVTQPSGKGNGKLTVVQSTLRSAASMLDSKALRVVSGAKIDLDLTKANLEGGDAPLSHGLSAEGGKTLTLQDGSFRGGVASFSVGAEVTELESVKIGGTPLFTARGTDGGISTGFHAVGVGQTTIKGGSFQGTVKNDSDPAESIGILIDAKPGVTSNPAVISGVTAEGGVQGNIRLGLVLGSVAASVKTSSIHGSKESGGLITIGVFAGALKDPNNPQKVLVTFPADQVLLEGNTILAGGNPASQVVSGNVLGYQAAGVLFENSVGPAANSTILQNKEIRGCVDACVGYGKNAFDAQNQPATAVGVWLTQGTHTVQENELIVGGNWAPIGNQENNAFTEHAGIMAIDGICLTEEGPSLCGYNPVGPSTTILGNKMVAGSGVFDGSTPQPLNKTRVPRYAYGLLALGGQVVADGGANRGRFLGGWAETANSSSGHTSTVFGAFIGGVGGSPQSPSRARHARFSAGSARTDPFVPGQARGLFVQGSPGVQIESNWIEGCGLETKSDLTPCNSFDAIGLQSVQNDGGLIANNYAFSGYGSTALACGLARTGGDNSNQNGEVFAFNLCVAQGFNGLFNNTSTGLALFSLTSGKGGNGFIVENNLFAVLANAKRYHLADVADAPHQNLKLNNNGFIDLSPEDASALGTTGKVSDMNNGIGFYVRRKDNNTYQELDSASQVNVIGNNNIQTTTKNFFKTSPIAYKAPTPDDDHLSPAACNQVDVAFPLGSVSADYDGDARSSDKPQIGPDECP